MLLLVVSTLFGTGKSLHIEPYQLHSVMSYGRKLMFAFSLKVFVSQRVPGNESDMNSRMNAIFISVLFMCVSSQNTVLKVFETERNMFYRHNNAKMYGTGAIVRAFTFAEIPFILMTSTAFTVIFYFFLG
jgi:ABC-type multidrug transport system permease subunit